MRYATLTCALIVALCICGAGDCRGAKIVLQNGDVLQGEIVGEDAVRLRLEHPVLGTIEVPRKGISEIETEGEPLPPVVEAAEADRWESRLEAGFSGARGNSDTLDAHARLSSRRETPAEEVRFDAIFFYGESEDVQTKEEFSATLEKDWLRPDSRWFTFAVGGYDYDRFQAWDHRLRAHGGVGYESVRRPTFKLRERVGLGLVKEFGSDEEDPLVEGLLGARLVWELSELQRVEGEVNLFPELTDVGKYRLTATGKWITELDTARGLTFSLGFEDEYRSHTEEEVEHNDLLYYGALGLEF